MNKHLVRKGLVLGIILLFIGASVVQGISFNVSKELKIEKSRGTLYVGGTGGGNYSTIQSAIDAASSGDTVFVYDDSSPYYEHVVITKSIDCIGENRDTTVIDGGGTGDVVYVSADFVNITGFTIKNGVFGINLYSSSNYNTITGNTASNNYIGIHLDSSSNNTVTGNNASNNNLGIHLDSSSNNNTITGNNASNNSYGIHLDSSSNNTVTGNNASNNGHGIFLDFSSNYNTITGNNASNNGVGILLDSSSNYNTITGNNANSNDPWGILLDSSSNNNTITGNNANSNNDYGIYLYSSSYNTVTGNNASNNDRGIRLHSYSNNNTITGNNANSNNYIGILLDFSSNNNLLYHNNLIDNTQNAYDTCTNYWDNGYPSGGNYWDDYTGEDTDGDGIGDTSYPIPGGTNEDRYPLMEPFIVSEPDIDGPTSGTAGESYEYTFVSTDPNGDDVKYYIDWGDGDTEWTGFSASGTPIIVSHTWAEEDTYTIAAKARDEYGLESDWATLEVVMPVNQQVINPLLQMILERFPNAFPILRYLLGL